MTLTGVRPVSASSGSRTFASTRSSQLSRDILISTMLDAPSRHPTRSPRSLGHRVASATYGMTLLTTLAGCSSSAKNASEGACTLDVGKPAVQAEPMQYDLLRDRRKAPTCEYQVNQTT